MSRLLGFVVEKGTVLPVNNCGCVALSSVISVLIPFLLWYRNRSRTVEWCVKVPFSTSCHKPSVSIIIITFIVDTRSGIGTVGNELCSVPSIWFTYEVFSGFSSHVLGTSKVTVLLL